MIDYLEFWQNRNKCPWIITKPSHKFISSCWHNTCSWCIIDQIIRRTLINWVICTERSTLILCTIMDTDKLANSCFKPSNVNRMSFNQEFKLHCRFKSWDIWSSWLSYDDCRLCRAIKCCSVSTSVNNNCSLDNDFRLDLWCNSINQRWCKKHCRSNTEYDVFHCFLFLFWGL